MSTTETRREFEKVLGTDPTRFPSPHVHRLEAAERRGPVELPAGGMAQASEEEEELERWDLCG